MSARSDLTAIAAKQALEALRSVAVGEALPLDSSSDLCDTLELLIPQLLRQSYPEWVAESIDGFAFCSTIRQSDDVGRLTGTCILISDQTVTPFTMDFAMAGAQPEFRRIRVRLGEAGGGALGISGPAVHSRAAESLLMGVAERLASIEWVYEISRGSELEEF